jgi:kelch-like protein 10
MWTGRIYIAGGFNGQECLNSAEYYEPGTNQWTVIAPMLHRRSGVGIIAYDDAIFAVGGFDGVERLCNTERYSVATNTWSLIADMYNRRSNFAIEVRFY